MQFDSLFPDEPEVTRKEPVYMDLVGQELLPDGTPGVRFRCKKCGSDTGWIEDKGAVAAREDPNKIQCLHCSSTMKSEILVPRINVASIRRQVQPYPEELLDGDISLLGVKGSGKTFTAKGLVEQLLAAKKRVLIIDPLSIWWALKSGKDGISEGFPLTVIGGDFADAPLCVDTGASVAKMVAKSRNSFIFDVLNYHREDVNRFLADFFEELFIANSGPIWVVIEEATEYVPQQYSRQGSLGRVVDAIDKMVRLGRSRGFRVFTITQRASLLNKNIMTQIKTLIAMRMIGEPDRQTIKAWVQGAGDYDKANDVLKTLASLKTGEGWVWFNPEQEGEPFLERVRFPLISTLDVSNTPAEHRSFKAGQYRLAPAPRVDLLKALAIADRANGTTLLEDLDKPPTAVSMLQVGHGNAVTEEDEPLTPEQKSAYSPEFMAGYTAGVKFGYRQAQKDARTAVLASIGQLNPPVDDSIPITTDPVKRTATSPARIVLDTPEIEVLQAVATSSLPFKERRTVCERLEERGLLERVNPAIKSSAFIVTPKGKSWLTKRNLPSSPAKKKTRKTTRR